MKNVFNKYVETGGSLQKESLKILRSAIQITDEQCPVTNFFHDLFTPKCKQWYCSNLCWIHFLFSMCECIIIYRHCTRGLYNSYVKKIMNKTELRSNQFAQDQMAFLYPLISINEPNFTSTVSLRNSASWRWLKIVVK